MRFRITIQAATLRRIAAIYWAFAIAMATLAGVACGCLAIASGARDPWPNLVAAAAYIVVTVAAVRLWGTRYRSNVFGGGVRGGDLEPVVDAADATEAVDDPDADGMDYDGLPPPRWIRFGRLCNELMSSAIVGVGIVYVAKLPGDLNASLMERIWPCAPTALVLAIRIALYLLVAAWAVLSVDGFRRGRHQVECAIGDPGDEER